MRSMLICSELQPVCLLQLLLKSESLEKAYKTRTEKKKCMGETLAAEKKEIWTVSEVEESSQRRRC